MHNYCKSFLKRAGSCSCEACDKRGHALVPRDAMNITSAGSYDNSDTYIYYKIGLLAARRP